MPDKNVQIDEQGRYFIKTKTATELANKIYYVIQSYIDAHIEEGITTAEIEVAMFAAYNALKHYVNISDTTEIEEKEEAHE